MSFGPPNPSPKGRLQFLLEDNAPGSSGPSSGPLQRLPDRGRARGGTRALSADAALGAGNPPTLLPPPPRSVDWLPRAPPTAAASAPRQHSADSLSSNGSVDIAAAAHAAAFRDDSSESGSASGCSPRVRHLPAPSMLPASHLLQSTAFGGLMMPGITSTPPPQAPSQQVNNVAYAHPHVPQSAVPPLPPHLNSPHLNSPHLNGAHLNGGATAAAAAAAAARIAPASAAPASRGGRGGRGQVRTEQQMRDRHDQRKMKNRISAAASRDRKKRSFNNLQRSLQEIELKYADQKRIIETLTLQLEECRSKLNAGMAVASIVLPDDLRHLAGGADPPLVSVQQLIDLLRHATQR